MSRRKKKKPAFDPAARARRMARAVVGSPPAGRVIPSKKKAGSKHRKRELERAFED